MAKDPNIAALAAYGGDYSKVLMSKLYRGLTAAKDLTLVEDVKNKLNLTKLEIGNGPKPGTGVFKPKTGDLNYIPRVLEVEEWQRDLNIAPRKYRTTYMAAMRGRGENPNNKTIPFAQFTWEKVIAQLASAINKRTIYFGKGKAAFVAFAGGTAYSIGDKVYYANPVDGEIEYWEALAATTAGQTPFTHPLKWVNRNTDAICEGFESKIVAGIASDEILPVETGVVNSGSGAYAQFKKMWRSQSEEQREEGCPTFCSWTDYDFLTDDAEDKVGKYTETDKDTGIKYLRGTERLNPIVPVLWLSSSRRLITAPKDIMLIGTDLMSDLNNIATEEHIYDIDAALSGVIGTQISDLSKIRVSNQS